MNDSQVRRRARRAGYIVRRDRRTGEYCLIDGELNALVVGGLALDGLAAELSARGA